MLICVSATLNDIMMNNQSPKSALSFLINTIQTNFYLLINLADFFLVDSQAQSNNCFLVIIKFLSYEF